MADDQELVRTGFSMILQTEDDILTKLGLRDRVQAVVLAYESGLVTPGR